METPDTVTWIQNILCNFVTEYTPLYELSSSVKSKLCAIISNNPIFLDESQVMLVDKTRNQIEHVLSMKWNKTNIKSLASLIETANKNTSWDQDQYRPSEVTEILHIEENILENVRDEIALAKDELSALKIKISQAKNYIQQITLTIGDLSSLFSLPQIEVPVLEIVDNWISNQDGPISTDAMKIETPEPYNSKIGEPLVKLIDIEVSEVSEVLDEKEEEPWHNNAWDIPQKNVSELYNTLLQYALFKTDNDKIAQDLIQSSMPRIWWYMQINAFQSWSDFLKEVLTIIDRNWKINYKTDQDYHFKKDADDFISEEEYTVLMQEISDWIKPALLELTDKEKIVIDMRYNQKLPFMEISTILGSSKSLPSVTINFAFKRMKDSLFNLSTKKEKDLPQDVTISTWTTSTQECDILSKDDTTWNDRPEDIWAKDEIKTNNDVLGTDSSINENPIETEKVIIKKPLSKVSPIQDNWKSVLEHKDLDILQESIFGYIVKMVKDHDTAQDLAQDVLIKIWNKLETGEYEEKWTFISWALRIAHNYTIDYFRNNKKKGIHISMTDYIENSQIAHPEDQPIEDMIIKKEIEQQLRVAITKLSSEQREVIQLRIYEELSFKEIAEKTGTNVNTALWRFRYAHKNLSKILWYTGTKKNRTTTSSKNLEIASTLNEPIDSDKIENQIPVQKVIGASWDSILNDPSTSWNGLYNVPHPTDSIIHAKIETDFSTFNSIVWEQINLPIITEGEWKANAQSVLEQYRDLVINVDRKSLTSLKSKIVAKCRVYEVSKSSCNRYVDFLNKMETVLDKIIYV